MISGRREPVIYPTRHRQSVTLDRHKHLLLCRSEGIIKHIICCFNKAFDATTVKAPAFEFISQHPSLLRLFGQRIGDLNLAAAPSLRGAQDIEDVRGQDIATNDRQV